MHEPLQASHLPHTAVRLSGSCLLSAQLGRDAACTPERTQRNSMLVPSKRLIYTPEASRCETKQAPACDTMIISNFTRPERLLAEALSCILPVPRYMVPSPWHVSIIKPQLGVCLHGMLAEQNMSLHPVDAPELLACTVASALQMHAKHVLA